MNITENNIEQAITNNVHDIERFNLVKKFDHYTKNGNGICKIVLFYIDNDFQLLDMTYRLRDLGIAKLSRNKTEWLATSNDLDYLSYYCKNLKQTRL